MLPAVNSIIENKEVTPQPEIQYGDPITISGNRQYQTATTKDTLGLFMETRDEDPIGYVSYLLDPEHPTEAKLHMNYSKTRKGIPEDQMKDSPPIVRRGLDKSGVFNAFEVWENFQGKGCGKDIWLLGAKELRKLGVRKIIISGDTTVSFSGDKIINVYEKLGAVVQEDGTQVVDIDPLLDKYEGKLEKMGVRN